MGFSAKDTAIIRELAKKVAYIADLPINDERRELWKKHNSLQSVRPLILLFPEGSWREIGVNIKPECEDQWARNIEYDLLTRIYQFEHFDDDKPVEKTYKVGKSIHNTGFNLPSNVSRPAEALGTWRYEPVVKNIDDLHNVVKMPIITHDEQKTKENLAMFNELFGDILTVQSVGITHISFHFMYMYIQLRGIDNMMMDLYDDPEMVHECMSLFQKGYQGMIDQYNEQNLFSLNNDETYHSSGGVGYTNELPKKDFNPNKIRTIDMWSSAEVQEFAVVSPEMHKEFAIAYEKPLLSQFGLNGYGCCEDLSKKMNLVFDIPNMRRLSISPWSNVKVCAEQTKMNYILSWKPQPSHLAQNFDEKLIENYIENAIKDSKGGILEMVLKDTHTCQEKPERFDMWSKIAKKAAMNA